MMVQRSDGDEEVGIPVVRAGRDIGLSRRFAAQVVALQDLDFVVAEAFEHESTVGRDAGSDVTFTLAVERVNGTGVRIAVGGVTGVKEYSHSVLLSF